MSDEQKRGRDVLENSFKNLGSFLASKGLPGKAKLSRAQQHQALPTDDPGGGSRAQGGGSYQHQGSSLRGRAASPPAAPSGASNDSSTRQSPEPPPANQPPGSGSSSAQQLDASLRRLALQGEGGSSSSQLAAAAAAAVAGGGAAADASVSQRRASSQIRVKKFHRLLDEQVVDVDALRELAWSGIPDELRPVCWKLLLGYLPPTKSRQAQVLARKRREYAELVPEFYDIENSARSEDEIGALRQVSVDVPRTAPNVPFFQGPLVQKSLERLLYIWGIRHPASGYVQGMNDLVTPFVAVFLSEVLPGELSTWTTDSLSEATMLSVEADCYWCLSKLLDGIQDHYTSAQPGIQRTVFRVKELISKNNGAISAHLDREGIDFLQFAFRWVNCLLIREVPFAAALRLWDTYLAEGARFADFLVYVCAAFLAAWESQICAREFQELMMFLQKLPTADWGEAQVESMLSSAFVLRNTWGSAQSHLQL